MSSRVGADECARVTSERKQLEAPASNSNKPQHLTLVAISTSATTVCNIVGPATAACTWLAFVLREHTDGYKDTVNSALRIL